eukprot:9446742-Karenia_brevis.AAC.1
MEPLLRRHHDIMKEIATAVVGTALTEFCWKRMQLPGPLSGVGITLPVSTADAAFVATWQAVTHRVEAIAVELGRPLVARVDEQAYEAALTRLELGGIQVQRNAD